VGLRESLARRAVRCAHVLVVETPGSWLTRVRLEEQLGQRGWRLAGSPAEADVLAVCGAPGPEMDEVASSVWQQMPGPRARVGIDTADPDVVAASLAEAERVLLDDAQQYDDGRGRSRAPEAGHEGDDTAGHDGSGGGHEHMDHGDGDHEHMDHGDGGMAPAGIPLAEGAEDRDGLEMDVLHVRLGPVLQHWPAGLVLRGSLHGDVIVEAEARLLDAAPEAGPLQAPERPGSLDAALRCDNAAHLLALAGWADAATRSREIRDALLVGQDTDAARLLAELRRRVARSRLLRWSLRGLGPLEGTDLERLGLPGRLEGDMLDRLLRILDRAMGAVSGHGTPGEESPEVDLGAVADVVTGLDLATARLVIAGLDLDPLDAGREASRA
jgi:hypothetical protein